jgi:hypothetical protein
VAAGRLAAVLECLDPEGHRALAKALGCIAPWWLQGEFGEPSNVSRVLLLQTRDVPMLRPRLATADEHQPHRTVYDAWRRPVEPRVSEIIVISMAIKKYGPYESMEQCLDQSHDSR